MDAVCVGSATIDAFILLHDLQKFSYDKFSNQISFPLGEKIPLDEYYLTLGGNACNVAVGLSRLGFQTSLAAEIGGDEFSKKIENDLQKEKVNQTLINKKSRKTPYFNIILSYEGERTILEEKVPDEQNLEAGNINPKIVYLTSIVGDWQKVYSQAFSDNPNSKFILNPSSRQLGESSQDLIKVLPKIEVLFVNIQEAQKILQEANPDIKYILGKLKDLGVGICVVTDGRNGSYGIGKDGKMFQISCASQNKPKERTGAGDAYAAGFLFGYLDGRLTRECMKYGAINAESVISQIGAQQGLLSREQIEIKYKELSALEAITL